jgi:cobalt/nickel transport system permease protein
MKSPRNTTLFVIAGLLIAAGLALFVSPLASQKPDGLNKVAQDTGLGRAERTHAFDDGPLAGYSVKGIGNDALAIGVSGLIGVLVTFGLGLGVFGAVRALRSRPRDATGQMQTAREGR